MVPEDMTSALLLFLKYPTPGKVKTRLAADLGEELTLELYRAMAADTLSAARETGHKITVCYDESTPPAHYRSWLGDDLAYLPQGGGNIGKRMDSCFKKFFLNGTERACLIGADIPELADRILNSALSSLSGHDCALGPSSDGGYYLVGFRSDSYCPEIFSGIHWSTPQVYSETISRLENAGRTVKVLDELTDIDTVTDLKELKSLRGKTAELLKTNSMRKLLCQN